MVDEIQLVRQFRSNVPKPSSEAHLRAWAAVVAAASEAEKATATSRGQVGPRRRRVAWAKWLAALAATAAVAIVAVELSSAGGAAHVPGASVTPWQASRLASQPVTAAAVIKPGALRLVSYIEGPTWAKAGREVPAGYLDCPAVDACYVLAQTVPSTAGPYPGYYDALYFSGDGGTSWASLPLPAHLEFTTALSCPGAMVCLGVGYQGAKNEFASTTDGGHQWTLSLLRAPANVMSLTCSSASACNLVTDGSGAGNAQQFARTTNGGASWYVHDFADSTYLSSLSCPTKSESVAIASSVGATTAGVPKAKASFALVTINAGRSWSRWNLPSTPAGALAPAQTGDLSLVSCPDSSHCVVFGGVTTSTNLKDLTKLPTRCPSTGCVLHDETTLRADIASTANAGRRWDLYRPPTLALGSFTFTYIPGQAYVKARYVITTAPAGPGGASFDLSCPSAGSCWVSGPGPTDLLWTTDGGSHWSRQLIGGDQGLVQVSCPKPGQCVALGAPPETVLNHQTPEYGRSAPVYSSITKLPRST
ncbi:MAG TPA: hypothetical protein VEJ84_20550 [Acidimicrobiales bacterium]|nr:hypothetical protein [Acidimicrobiales bacterium]